MMVTVLLFAGVLLGALGAVFCYRLGLIEGSRLIVADVNLLRSHASSRQIQSLPEQIQGLIIIPGSHGHNPLLLVLFLLFLPALGTAGQRKAHCCQTQITCAPIFLSVSLLSHTYLSSISRQQPDFFLYLS